MESLAPPGTEDSITAPVAPTFVSKKNSETDRLLSLRYTLPDGSASNVFEQTWQNGSEIWYCRVCHCPVMGQVFNHEAGKRHVGALEAASATRNRMSSANAAKMPASMISGDWDEPKEEVRVAPGEPVPPGVDGEITKVAKIQERLDNFKTNSVIGLEYLLELQDYDQEREPSYFCLLCGKKGDFRTIIPHLVSYNHLQNYLQRHYKKTFTALVPYSSHKMYKKCWQECLTKIADAIEGKYGRMLPHPIDVDTYERNKQEVYNKVINGPHFSDSNGVGFEHLVNQEEITRVSKAYMDESRHEKKPINLKKTEVRRARRSLSNASSISSDEFDCPTRERPFRVAKPAVSSLYNRRRRSRTRSRSKSPYRRREDTLPWNRPDYRKNEIGRASTDRRSKELERDRDRDRERDRERDRDNDKKDKFRRLATAIENDMERQLRQHQMNPEKHPQYNEEWKIFWNKRYKELQAEGKNTQGYDFKPEWIVYWNNKMEEFHKGDVKKSIDALRRRLGLAEVTPISFKINTASTMPSSARRREGKSGCQPVAAQPDQDHEVIVIDDSRDEKRHSREDSHSPWESDTNSPRKDFRRRPAVVKRTKTRSPSKSRSRSGSPYRRRSFGRRRSRSRSRSRSSRRYRRDGRTTRSRSKSPQIRREADSKATASRRSADWDRGGSYKSQQNSSPIPFAPSGKDVIMVRESTLKKKEILEEQITAVEDLGTDVNIVAVLRLLTALEDKLGSLGPKVVDLLAMALSMEKKSPNSSEQLLDDETHCVMFETIKEKLKGLLHAGLVAGFPSQEKAIKTSIPKIAGLLHLATKRKTETEAKQASVMTIDKVAIAMELSKALVLQGKEVTQAELEQLVNAAMSMAKAARASKGSDKPMTTASFLEMLKQSKPKPPTPSKTDVKATEPEKIAKASETEAEKEVNSLPKDAMDGLSDLELQTLLQSFKDLSAEEQHGLISYLKKLEAKDPARVETLRKFVNADSFTSAAAAGASKADDHSAAQGRISPFSKKLSESTSVHSDAKKDARIGMSDDEDDYSYEDVFKAASNNVSNSEKAQAHAQTQDVSSLIANIMVSIASNANATTTAPTMSMANAPAPTPVVLTQASQQLQHQAGNHGNSSNNSNSGNIFGFTANNSNNKGFQPRPQQQPYRQFMQNAPRANMQHMQPNMHAQMQNMPRNPHNAQHNFQDNMQPMQQRFYPNKDPNLNQNQNQNYNYYNNRW